MTHEPDIAAHARRVIVLRDGVIASDDEREQTASRSDSLDGRGLIHELVRSFPSRHRAIRVQKLKSFFTLLGVAIGVMFLIAVVSVVEGMGRYMEHDLVGKIVAISTFELAQRPERQHGRRGRRYLGKSAETAADHRGRRASRRRRASAGDAVVHVEPRTISGQSAVRSARRVHIFAVAGDYFSDHRTSASSAAARSRTRSSSPARWSS